jgi:hypothetical protein
VATPVRSAKTFDKRTASQERLAAIERRECRRAHLGMQISPHGAPGCGKRDMRTWTSTSSFFIFFGILATHAGPSSTFHGHRDEPAGGNGGKLSMRFREEPRSVLHALCRRGAWTAVIDPSPVDVA